MLNYDASPRRGLKGWKLLEKLERLEKVGGCWKLLEKLERLEKLDIALSSAACSGGRITC